jgi:hypothetical protein
MSQDHSRIRHLMRLWNDEDATRDEHERRAKQLFLEEQATPIFAPIEDFLTRLDGVLRGGGGSVEIDPRWQHLGDEKLSRVAKVTSAAFTRQMTIDLTIQGARIFYRGTPYCFSPGVRELIVAITREVEQFLRPR